MPDDIFRWVIAIGIFVMLAAFAVQTVVVYAMYRVTKATQDKILPVLDAVTPILVTIRRFVDDNAPKFSQMASDAGKVVKDLNERARAQLARIDDAVERVQYAGDAVKIAILKPVKQVSGIMHGIRAALSVWRTARRESIDQAHLN